MLKLDVEKIFGGTYLGNPLGLEAKMLHTCVHYEGVLKKFEPNLSHHPGTSG